MLCDSTKTLLQTIFQRLENPDQTEWDDQMESAKQCLYEMHQMTRPLYRAYRTMNSDKWPSHIPDGERLNRAMPHVKLMVSAIRRKDQPGALESVRAALAEMNGSAASKPAPEPASVAIEHEQSAGKRRAAVGTRRTSKRTRVASTN